MFRERGNTDIVGGAYLSGHSVDLSSERPSATKMLHRAQCPSQQHATHRSVFTMFKVAVGWRIHVLESVATLP